VVGGLSTHIRDNALGFAYGSWKVTLCNTSEGCCPITARLVRLEFDSDVGYEKLADRRRQLNMFATLDMSRSREE
jgi:hypothetical protein